MLFNFVWTPTASAELGARADGTPAGGMIGQGLTPHSAAMAHGITAAMNSVAELDTSCVRGGATSMWDLDSAWASVPLVKQLLLRFLNGAGMIFQGNMTSVAELEQALADPEAHPNLIVRVGGYSARFNTLSDELKREIITRRRHAG